MTNELVIKEEYDNKRLIDRIHSWVKKNNFDETKALNSFRVSLIEERFKKRLDTSSQLLSDILDIEDEIRELEAKLSSLQDAHKLATKKAYKQYLQENKVNPNLNYLNLN